MGKNRGIGQNILQCYIYVRVYEKNIKTACAHCYWSKKFEMSRAEGKSLLAVAATNLFQVVAAWKSGERWKKDLFGRWTWMERDLFVVIVKGLAEGAEVGVRDKLCGSVCIGPYGVEYQDSANLH